MPRRVTPRGRLALVAVAGLLLAGCASSRPAETPNQSHPGPALPSVSIPPPTYTATPSASATPTPTPSGSASPSPTP